MLDAFLSVFYATAAQMVELIVPVIGIWLIFDFTSSLLFKD